MQGPNFYGQSLKGSLSAYNPTFFQPVLPRLSINSEALWPARDSFTNKPSRFESALHQQGLALIKRQQEIDDQIKNLDPENITEQLKNSLMRQNSLMEHAKKMLKLIVDNMQKCAETIVANMR